ncbi:hypothetical protein EF903_28595, partial [Streptomyces sp. WAC05292]|uniref:TetR-like C-terminal domain-containing protein n=1 Tax=Streptomyces sp. WAC05292 TaxID=2487418 RepID=UPI000F7479C4
SSRTPSAGPCWRAAGAWPRPSYRRRRSAANCPPVWTRQPPWTGSLHGDVRALLEVFSHLLRHPVASAVIPDLLVEAARHPELADAVRGALLEGRRRMAEAVVSAAQERGELPAGVDPAAALDLVAGPLYWRQTVIGQPVAGPELDVLARQVVAGLKAAPAAG